MPKHQTELKHLFAFFLAIIALILFMSWNDARPTYIPKGARHAQSQRR